MNDSSYIWNLFPLLFSTTCVGVSWKISSGAEEVMFFFFIYISIRRCLCEINKKKERKTSLNLHDFIRHFWPESFETVRSWDVVRHCAGSLFSFLYIFSKTSKDRMFGREFKNCYIDTKIIYPSQWILVWLWKCHLTLSVSFIYFKGLWCIARGSLAHFSSFLVDAYCELSCSLNTCGPLL